MLCETKTTVRPAFGDLVHAAEASPLEVGVADGEDLVDDQDVGVQMDGDREASRTYMPLE